jgi:hypothetical protein
MAGQNWRVFVWGATPDRPLAGTGVGLLLQVLATWRGYPPGWLRAFRSIPGPVVAGSMDLFEMERFGSIRFGESEPF